MLRNIFSHIGTSFKNTPTGTLGLVAFTLYSVGFIVWNQRLVPFGFFEYNLLQVRFFAAGVVFIVMLLIIILMLDYLMSHFNQLQPELPTSVTLLIVTLLTIILFSSFQSLFVRVPQWLGGARPLPTTILGTGEQINYLSDLGIGTVESGKGKPAIQTVPVCLIYQNDRYIVFQSVNKAGLRNVPLARDRFVGFSSVNPDSSQRGCEALQ